MKFFYVHMYLDCRLCILKRHTWHAAPRFTCACMLACGHAAHSPLLSSYTHGCITAIMLLCRTVCTCHTRMQYSHEHAEVPSFMPECHHSLCVEMMMTNMVLLIRT